MKRLNAKGFGAIEVLLILVILGIVGGTGFYVYSANKKIGNGNDGTTFTQKKDAAKKEPEKLDKFTHSQLGYSFNVPKGWTAVETEPWSENDYKKVEVKSPDYLNEEREEEGYPSVESGARIILSVSPEGNYPVNVDDIESKKNSESTHEGKVEVVSVDGQKALQYIWAYEGPPRYIIEFNKDSNNYYFHIDSAFDGNYKSLEEKFGKYKSEFSTVINSFKFK